MSTRFLTTITILVLIIGTLFLDMPQARAASYNKNNLCADSAFINKNALSQAGIQSFLVAKGSFLRNYSTGGRTAAKIIYDAAQAYGINPIAIMSTIQKEEGLIYGTYAKSFIQVRMDWAMGYGYTDSVIIQKYKGFASQIDNGTWQLRRNYDYWATNGSAWNVNKTMTIDGTAVKFANRCTSALYRYTPHLGGNYSFWYYFNLWGGKPVASEYSATFVSRTPASPTTVQPGQTFNVSVSYKNTGTATWSKTGSYPVRLGTDLAKDRTSVFFSGNRLLMTQATVKPGATGTFTGIFVAPPQVGSYTENFLPVAENKTWFNGNDGMRWIINVAGEPVEILPEDPPEEPAEEPAPVDPAAGYNADLLSQSPRNGQVTIKAGRRITLLALYRNIGTNVFTNSTINLGAKNPGNAASVFVSANHINLIQKQVRVNGLATFRAYFVAPAQRGVYTEKFQPMLNGSPFGEIVTWTITVK